MSDERKRRGWVWWTAVTLIVVVLYVLSIGPVAWLVEKSGNHPIAINAWFFLYLPIIWARFRWPPAGAAIEWYGNLFGINL